MAIMTAAEARLYIRGITGTGEDANLNALIARADALFAGYIGLPSPTVGGNPTLEDVRTRFTSTDRARSIFSCPSCRSKVLRASTTLTSVTTAP